MRGDWHAFPETIRKVSKHASTQTLLIHTAAAEHAVALQAAQRGTRSTGAVETLADTLKNTQNRTSQEAFQGESCLAWASLVAGITARLDVAPAPAIVALFDKYGTSSRDTDISSTWTKICLVKSAYTQAQSYINHDDATQAQIVLSATSTWVTLNRELVHSVPQLSYWSEQALAQLVSLNLTEQDQMQTFQSWSSLASKSPEVSASVYGNGNCHVSRSQMWSAYYTVLSRTLRQPQIYNSIGMTRLQMVDDLRSAEMGYESSFLKNKPFPKATESNKAVEDWVEQVIHNWHVVCGSDWRDSDLGQGGRSAVTRNVLDILYRAAGKTFQSTLILRRLFQVHLALAEFDLAYHFLDTYVELIERSKARATKAGLVKTAEDSDELVLVTVSEGVEALCAYGQQREARKAYELALKVEEWLNEHMPHEDNVAQPNGHADITEPVRFRPLSPLSAGALQIVHRAIGIAKAQWARWTPFGVERNGLQTRALSALKRAVTLSEPELATIYALALIAAETREMSTALLWTKAALQRTELSDRPLKLKDYCAFWHLMTLLLTSQQEFDAAHQSCSIALDRVFRETVSRQDAFSDAILGVDENLNRPAEVEGLECSELQRIVELEITRLSLIELNENVEAALNHSNELVLLYSRLFKQHNLEQEEPPVEINNGVPKLTSGTIKSIRGSIFSRRRDPPSHVAPSNSEVISGPNEKKNGFSESKTKADQTPMIQVTDEEGRSPRKSSRLSLRRHHHHHHHDRPPPSTINGAPLAENEGSRRSSNVSASTTTHTRSIRQSLDGPDQFTSRQQAQLSPLPESKEKYFENSTLADSQHDGPSSTVPPGDGSTFERGPLPHFSRSLNQRHAQAVLCKIWLTTATLYRRGSMFEDAAEACEEASKAARSFEVLVTATDPSTKALTEAGWGCVGRSSDEVWADVYCARGELRMSVIKREQEEERFMSNDRLREVIELYEQCLMYHPDHAGGIIGLSRLLLDYYERKIDLGKRLNRNKLDQASGPDAFNPDYDEDKYHGDTVAARAIGQSSNSMFSPGDDLRKTPENLNRIAARDRAYGLLSTLTKTGHGWDNSEAWFLLARAHELGGEIDRSKSILWWCIELEDTKPIRHWQNLSCKGYVL